MSCFHHTIIKMGKNISCMVVQYTGRSFCWKLKIVTVITKWRRFMEPVRGTKPHSMYEKSDVKTNIIRYYFAAIHPMDKAISGTEGQGWSRDTLDWMHLIYMHTCVLWLCSCRKNTRFLASPAHLYFSHIQSRATRDGLCQCVTWSGPATLHCTRSRHGSAVTGLTTLS